MEYFWTVTATLVHFLNDEIYPSNGVHLCMHFLKGEIHTWLFE